MLGSSRNGKNGTGRSRKNIETPLKVESLSQVEQISCGMDFCLSLDAKQQVNSWGVNNFGQLGGYEQYLSNEPHLVRYLSNKKIVKVSPKCNKSYRTNCSGSHGRELFARIIGKGRGLFVGNQLGWATGPRPQIGSQNPEEDRLQIESGGYRLWRLAFDAVVR